VVGEAPPNASAVELADQVQAQLKQVLARLSDLLERAQQARSRKD
jgi:enamine deaminase RidA (YjgF/YER057c/UK114 family)